MRVGHRSRKWAVGFTVVPPTAPRAVKYVPDITVVLWCPHFFVTYLVVFVAL